MGQPDRLALSRLMGKVLGKGLCSGTKLVAVFSQGDFEGNAVGRELGSADLREVLSRLQPLMILEAAVSYLKGRRLQGFSETPKSYALDLCKESTLLPVRHVVAIAAEDWLGLTLTGQDMASGKTTLCKERLEELGFRVSPVAD
jgi:hypothetical protein